MIIHSYLTDGFYDWAELFVKSFIYHHDNTHKIFLSTRGLTEEQIEKLQSVSPNLHISNKKLNLKEIANRAKVPVNKILKLKNHIENEAVTKNTYIWKQAISVEDRYRNSIIEAMNFYSDEDYLIHFDIDMYFRKHLQDLFDIVTLNDISIKFRLKSKISRKVMGGLIGFKISKKTRQFMKRWVHHIDAIPLDKKPLGYGQTSFYLTYCDMKDELKWGYVPSRFISPRFTEADVVWSGNTKAGKAKNLIRCVEDFTKRKNYNETK